MHIKAARNEISENSSLEHYVATRANFANIVTAAMGLAMVIVLFGVVVLISCYAEDDYRKILGDLIAVQGSTAVGFILSGSALYLQCLNAEHASRRLVLAARIVAVLLLLLGAAFLLQNVFGVTLLRDSLSAISLAHSAFGAEIHPLAAGSFVLIALILLLHDARIDGRHYPAEYLSFILIGLSAIPLVGYLYGVNKLTFLHYSTGIPLLSALVFLLLGAALLMARPSHRLMAIIVSHAPGGNMLRRLLPSMLLLILALNLLVGWGAQQGYYAQDLVLPLLTLVNGSLLVFIFWRSAGNIDREYGARV